MYFSKGQAQVNLPHKQLANRLSIPIMGDANIPLLMLKQLGASCRHRHETAASEATIQSLSQFSVMYRSMENQQ